MERRRARATLRLAHLRRKSDGAGPTRRRPPRRGRKGRSRKGSRSRGLEARRDDVIGGEVQEVAVADGHGQRPAHKGAAAAPQ
eukprot:1967355-Alexandrium_andersonii.AAC.1